LPPLSSLSDPIILTEALSKLFEPSHPLRTLLVPQLLPILRTNTPTTYFELIDICVTISKRWKWEEKAEFLSGHPEIGAPAIGISNTEQNKAGLTSQAVLRRLKHLNSLYRIVFPGLVYITFVNGRPRSDIVPELERIIGITPSPAPIPDDWPLDIPTLDSTEVKGLIRPFGSEEWKEECERGLGEVWKIARARLKTMDLE
ncbi:hypothetical protein TREMEDRAFT_18980, partial [Tremella mesenterica DSM 1558]|uniref:uncharacterized protein n=1 Tax=Tremella mesenterica (strain ATCC 24925 / CBS 8224 / DSM 1558 / NBRC 9311 / NRRL Y-6157 / RJB 2259-6 / UBC 559-6) TaxID=578456 RepID=UPI0003F4977A